MVVVIVWKRSMIGGEEGEGGGGGAIGSCDR